MSIERAVDKSFIDSLYIAFIAGGRLRLRHQLAVFDFCLDHLKRLLDSLALPYFWRSITGHLHSANVIQIALMAIFPLGFFTNIQGRVLFYLKNVKDRVLFKNVLLRDRISFSGIWLWDRVAFQIFQRHRPVCSQTRYPLPLRDLGLLNSL